MTDKDPSPGTIEWQDLSVDDASTVKDFYEQVVGWQPSAVSMDDGAYEDFTMNLPGSGDTVAGICHARGYNQGLPAQWLIYVRVASVPDSIEKCQALGGKLLWGPKDMSNDQFCVIQDPRVPLWRWWRRNNVTLPLSVAYLCEGRAFSIPIQPKPIPTGLYTPY